MSAADAELDALRRPFRLGLLAVLAVVVAIGGVVAAFGSNADRPAGIAERWLVALSDTTREGVFDDAVDRMHEYELDDPNLIDAGPFELIPELRDDRGAEADGKARFDTIRVGRPVDDVLREGTVLVPVEVTPYEADDAVEAYVMVTKLYAADGDWKVLALGTAEAFEDLSAIADLCPADQCPGFPIERPERAPIGFFLGALALGVLIAIGCSAAIRAATPGGRAGREAVSAAAS